MPAVLDRPSVGGCDPRYPQDNVVAPLLSIPIRKIILLSMSPGLRRAIESAGSISELARRLGISQQAVSQWDEVPPRKVVAIEKATGIPREELRPELYRR